VWDSPVWNPRVGTGASPVPPFAAKLVAVVAPLQGRLIVVTARRRPVGASTVGGRSPPQARFAGVLVINHFAPVLKRSQTRLHIVEFRCGHSVFRPRRQDLFNFFLRLAIRSGVCGCDAKVLASVPGFFFSIA